MTFQKGMKAPWTSERNKRFKGNLNPNYKGETCVSLTKNHALYKELILKPCEKCNCASELIHHKDGNRKNNKRINLMPVCYSCHAKIHGKLTNFGDRLFRKGWKKPKKFEVVE